MGRALSTPENDYGVADFAPSIQEHCVGTALPDTAGTAELAELGFLLQRCAIRVDRDRMEAVALFVVKELYEVFHGDVVVPCGRVAKVLNGH